MTSDVIKEEVKKLAEKIGPHETLKCLVKSDVSVAVSQKLVKGSYAHNLTFETKRNVVKALKRLKRA